MITVDRERTAENLKQLRQAKGLSIREVGYELKVSTQSVYMWENGRNVPSIDSLIILSELYGAPLDMLIVRR